MTCDSRDSSGEAGGESQDYGDGDEEDDGEEEELEGPRVCQLVDLHPINRLSVLGHFLKN